MADRKLVVQIVGDSRSAEKAFKRAGKSADTFHGKVGGAAKSITKGLAVAGVAVAGIAVALGIKAVTAAAAFEKSMSRVVGLAGQSRSQVAKWSDQLIGLGPALAKSPQELAEALYFVASSGVAASKAMSVVTASAKASTAGLGETEVVADAVTSVMNAYASSNMTAANATDVLVATVREGKGEADAFAGVIGNVAAFASRLKVPFEEVGAALASMTQLGTDPRTAATQLQAFFASMLKQTDKARTAAKKVGFDFDLGAEVLQRDGLLAVLDLIKEKFAGNTQAMAKAFPNIRALRSLLALTADDGGKVAGVFNRMADSSGSLKTAFGAASKTSSTNIDRFKAALSALQIAFGQGLLPMVNKVATALGKKLMDPKFVAYVRRLGLMIGTGLLKAFTAISQWFSAHWPQIQGGFRTFVTVMQAAARHAGTLKAVLVTITKPLQIQLKILLAIWDTVLGAVSTGAGILSHLPDKLGGGKFAGIQEAVDQARTTLKNPLAAPPKKGKPPKIFEGSPGGRARARGGPVMAGARYLVGEHGPETFVPGRSGTVVANGGGPSGDIVINLDGREIARVVSPWQDRMRKNRASQTRGRHGGNAWST